MKVKEAKAGHRYRLYVDESTGEVVGDRTTNKTLVSTVIAIYKDSSKFLFGWKPNEDAPDNSRDRDGTNPSSLYNYIPTQKEYNHSLTINASAVMHSKVLEPGEMDGCMCGKCHNFYPYAEPNQEDGTLICYSCRTTW